MRLKTLGWSSALVGALRRGWRILVAAGCTHRLRQARLTMTARTYGRRRTEAFHRWRMLGRVAWPVHQQVLRAYELASALLLLFRWRHWADECLACRHEYLLSAALPLVHGLRRWRDRVAQSTAMITRHTLIIRQPRAKKLALALQHWHDAAARHRRVGVMLTIAESDAMTTRLSRGFRRLNRVLWRRRHMQMARTKIRRKTTGAAMLRWRWHRAECEAERAASGVRRCISDGLCHVWRARAYGRWVRWRHLWAARRARALHARVLACRRVWLRGWTAILSASTFDRARAGGV